MNFTAFETEIFKVRCKNFSSFVPFWNNIEILSNLTIIVFIGFNVSFLLFPVPAKQSQLDSLCEFIFLLSLKGLFLISFFLFHDSLDLSILNSSFFNFMIFIDIFSSNFKVNWLCSWPIITKLIGQINLVSMVCVCSIFRVVSIRSIIIILCHPFFIITYNFESRLVFLTSFRISIFENIFFPFRWLALSFSVYLLWWFNLLIFIFSFFFLWNFFNHIANIIWFFLLFFL